MIKEIRKLLQYFYQETIKTWYRGIKTKMLIVMIKNIMDNHANLGEPDNLDEAITIR